MIERLIDIVVAEKSPSHGDNLLGMKFDISAYFTRDHRICVSHIEETQDKRSLLNMTLSVDEQCSTIQDLSHFILQGWERVRYRYFDSTSLVWYSTSMRFRFITIIAEDGFYVTGMMSVGGDQYKALVQRYEQEYGEPLQRKSLPPYVLNE